MKNKNQCQYDKVELFAEQLANLLIMQTQHKKMNSNNKDEKERKKIDEKSRN